MNYEERANQIKKELDQASQKRDRAQGTLDSLKAQKEEIIKEIINAGSTPETIKADLDNIAKEIEEKLQICEQLIKENNAY